MGPGDQIPRNRDRLAPESASNGIQRENEHQLTVAAPNWIREHPDAQPHRQKLEMFRARCGSAF